MGLPRALANSHALLRRGRHMRDWTLTMSIRRVLYYVRRITLRRWELQLQPELDRPSGQPSLHWPVPLQPRGQAGEHVKKDGVVGSRLFTSRVQPFKGPKEKYRA